MDNSITFLQQVMPTEARLGDVVTVTGVALDARHFKEIYLTNGEVDYRVEILEQSYLAVRLRAPAKSPLQERRQRHSI